MAIKRKTLGLDENQSSGVDERLLPHCPAKREAGTQGPGRATLLYVRLTGVDRIGRVWSDRGLADIAGR